MEKVTLKLVNTGLAGEPEHIAFQDPITLKVVEFDDVSFVVQNEVSRSANMEEDWKYVLNHMSHVCEAEWDEDGITTIYLT